MFQSGRNGLTVAESNRVVGCLWQPYLSFPSLNRGNLTSERKKSYEFIVGIDPRYDQYHQIKISTGDGPSMQNWFEIRPEKHVLNSQGSSTWRNDWKTKVTDREIRLVDAKDHAMVVHAINRWAWFNVGKGNPSKEA